VAAHHMPAAFSEAHRRSPWDCARRSR
jgi:hypothetical protein